MWQLRLAAHSIAAGRSELPTSIGSDCCMLLRMSRPASLGILLFWWRVGGGDAVKLVRDSGGGVLAAALLHAAVRLPGLGRAEGETCSDGAV